MRLKITPVVISLGVLGLIAMPAFANVSATANANTQSQLDAMKAQLNKMEAVINQNNAGGFQQVADWTNRITISGLLNVDGYMSNTTPNFGIPTKTIVVTGADEPAEIDSTTTIRHVDGNTSNLAVNNANLFVDALVNDWTNVHLGLQYNSNRKVEFSREVAESSPTFDEGYVTIANFTESPLFFRAGREYLPFGVYNRYPMVQNPTQLLSETSATAAQAGFVSPAGVYGSVYGFRGLKESSDPSNRPRIENWGADLGYAYSDASYGLKLDAGYIRNMADVNYVSNTTTNLYTNGYHSKVGGLALSADGNIGPVDASLRYAGALQKFKSSDVAMLNSDGTTGGAEPAAYGVELGYTFPVLAHQSRIGAGYQHTYNAAPVFTASTNKVYAEDADHYTATTTYSTSGLGSYGLPANRYYADYIVNISKWTDVGFELYHDKDYSVSKGGTGTSATVGILQLSVKFA